tara:strand:+ start:56 stop:475 length:420 start_codon:yes stop_codon:yes gene_type:complete
MGDGPAKHWLLCRIGKGYYAGIVPETRDGNARYVVELCMRDLDKMSYVAASRHTFATALDAATFFCAHAESVRRSSPEESDNPTVWFGVVDPEQTTKLFEDDVASGRGHLAALAAPTLRASWHCPEPIALLIDAVKTQV